MATTYIFATEVVLGTVMDIADKPYTVTKKEDFPGGHFRIFGERVSKPELKDDIVVRVDGIVKVHTE